MAPMRESVINLSLLVGLKLHHYPIRGLSLQDQHAIAVTVKAITLADRLRVGAQ